MTDHQVIAANWVQRAGTATYILVVALSGIAGAFIGFMLFGLIATAASASDGITALLALAGAILGFAWPAYALWRKRRTIRTPKESVNQPSVRKEPTLATAESASIGGANQIPPIDDGQEWFYTDDGKRIGPVPSERICALLAEGAVGRSTQVWRKGFANWQPLNDTELAAQLPNDQPPPLSSAHIGNGFVWALAFAPVWASVLHYTLAYFYLSAKYGLFFEYQLDALVLKTWYFFWGVNVMVAAFDERALKNAGVEGAKKLSNWLTFLVPVYIYKRDHIVGAGVTRFVIWMVCFFLSLLPIWF